MSKADRMFLDLGMPQQDTTADSLNYKGVGQYSAQVYFDLNSRTYRVSGLGQGSDSVSVVLHLAIAEKVKELGWLTCEPAFESTFVKLMAEQSASSSIK